MKILSVLMQLIILFCCIGSSLNLLPMIDIPNAPVDIFASFIAIGVGIGIGVKLATDVGEILIPNNNEQ